METQTPQPLLSRLEQLLYGRLVRAFPGHIVLSHVALSRLLIVDFVVCRADFTPLAVFEVDDALVAHVAPRDLSLRKDQSLQALGFKVIHVSADDLPHEPALKALAASHPLHTSTAELVRRAS